MKSCTHLWKVDALGDGSLAASEATSFERHAKLCRECRDRIRLDLQLRALAPRLRARGPDELRLRRLRERILSDACESALRPRSRLARVWLVGAAALAAVLVIGWFARHRWRPADASPFAGRVTPGPGALWSQARVAKVETVTLTHGELRIMVRKQTEGERFLVEVPDGELEVRGTTFDLLVSEGSTRHIHVVEGVVAVALQHHAVVELASGQTLDLGAPDVQVAPELAPSAAPPSSDALAPVPAPPAPLRAVAPPQPGNESTDYEAVMKLYRTARYADAAAGFRQFAVRHRDSDLLEDATFLEALSLTKAGQVDRGAVAAWRHLAEYPSSFHKKEASVLVARAARDRGDCEEARRVLAPWLASRSDPTIREALGACLEPL